DAEQYQGDLQTLQTLRNENLITAQQFQEAIGNLALDQAQGIAAPTDLSTLYPTAVATQASSGTNPLSSSTLAAGETSSTPGFSATQPSGTTVEPGLVDNSQGQWQYSATGASGAGWYQSDIAASSNPLSGPTTAGTNPFTPAQIAALAGGQSVSSGPLTPAQVAAVGESVAAYEAAHPPTQNYAASTGSSPYNYNPYADLPGGVLTAAMLATQGSWSYGGGSSAPVTINITGMTPSNAQTVVSQMTPALRQAGAKIT